MYHLINLLSFLVSKVSFRTLDKWAHILTMILFQKLGIRRRIVFKNLDIVYGQGKRGADKLRIAQSCFYHFMLTILEFLHARNGDLAKNVKIADSEVYNTAKMAFAKGGAYVITLHMGNWEASASAVSQQIKPVYAVVKKVGSEGINQFVTELRKANSFHTIVRQTTGDAVRAMRKVLANGHISAVILDQSRPGEPHLPFFGTPARTNTSFARIWALMKAPVFVAYSTRTKVGHHTLVFNEELHFVDTGDAEKDVLANSLLVNEAIEKCIRACPEQYFWLHDRWKK